MRGQSLTAARPIGQTGSASDGGCGDDGAVRETETLLPFGGLQGKRPPGGRLERNGYAMSLARLKGPWATCPPLWGNLHSASAEMTPEIAPIGLRGSPFPSTPKSEHSPLQPRENEERRSEKFVKRETICHVRGTACTQGNPQAGGWLSVQTL